MSSEFHLDDSFLRPYTKKEVPWGPVGYITYKRTYAGLITNLRDGLKVMAAIELLLKPGATEEWWLTCARVVEGTYYFQKKHVTGLKLPWSESKAQRSAQRMYDLMFHLKWLPPGRGIRMMGTEYVRKNGGACLNNCAFVSTNQIATDFAAPFTFLMDMSMLGVGVGFDTKGAGLVEIVAPGPSPLWTHVVEDSREGWVDLVRIILEAFQGRPFPLRIDYSKLREAGTPIKGFGGTSSGPEPLKALVQSLTTELYAGAGKPITSTTITNIANLIGLCVVSGNIRRSAELALGSPSDEEFLALKDYDVNPERAVHGWVSNNSVCIEDGDGVDYEKLGAATAAKGEPGYFWLDNARAYGRMCDPEDWADRRVMGANPCVEQSLESFELCCLVETNPAAHRDATEFRETLKYSYLYGKTVTTISTHDARANAVMLRNRRIGCSQTGIVQAVKKFGVSKYKEDFLEDGYDYLKVLDQMYSDWLCIPRSIKITSVKPSGTVSLLMGATPGIHQPHSEYYFRVIRFGSNSEYLPELKSAGYRCVPLDPLEPNTVAVYFPIHEQNFDRGKKDVTMWEQMELAALLQGYWADNQVSATITFKQPKLARDCDWLHNALSAGELDPNTVVDPGEAKDIPRALQLYQHRLKGVSFLPLQEGTYAHMPYQTITESQYIEYADKLLPLSLSGGHEMDDKFCDGEACEVPSD
jgi:ribonucleoside-triphosphate reductase